MKKPANGNADRKRACRAAIFAASHGRLHPTPADGGQDGRPTIALSDSVAADVSFNPFRPLSPLQC